jgi:beta-glucosidase
VLNNGAPLRLPWIERVSAVVEAWLPGQEGARAVAEVLLGMTNPCGKPAAHLPAPARGQSELPVLFQRPRRALRRRRIRRLSLLREEKIEPLFPFGHGLSYTTFEYSNLRAPDDVMAGQPIHVSLEVANTGTLPGRETVQLYVGDEVTQDVVRPVKELKGFHKVELAPGESQIVRFTLNTHDLAYYDRASAARGSRRPASTGLYAGSSAATFARRVRSTGSHRSTSAHRSSIDFRGRPLMATNVETVTAPDAKRPSR